MFCLGFIKIANASAAKGALAKAGDFLRGSWSKAKPYAQGALTHLKTPAAGYGAAAGAIGGAATGMGSIDPYTGRPKGLSGAIEGAIKGGIAGGAAGGIYNRVKKGPATIQSVVKPKKVNK